MTTRLPRAKDTYKGTSAATVFADRLYDPSVSMQRRVGRWRAERKGSQVSMVYTAGQAKTKLTAPNPIDAYNACRSVYPERTKMVEE